MLRVECSRCGDIVEFSGDAVGQGFMCLPCSESTEAEQFYEDMAPASAPIPEIDATNALISDLEAQNTNLLNEITSLDNRIVELRKNAEITLDDLCYWRGRVMYWIGRVSKAEDRVSKAEDHPWKNLWAYLWK